MKLVPRAVLALTIGLIAAGCQQKSAVPNTQTAAAPQADAKTSAAQLPDWSGTWSMTEETRDTRVAGGGNIRALLTPKYAALLPSFPARGPAPSGAKPLPRGLLKQNLTQCIPPGFPGNLLHPWAHEYLFTPGRVTMLIEDGEVRRIYTDGRQHPPLNELDDSLVGHSIGHWEGDTLVVDTVGIRPEAELSMGLHPTPATHIVERIHKKDADLMQIDTVITDPDMFAQPLTYTLVFNRVKGELMENNCMLDQRDNDQEIDLTPPPPATK